MSERKAATCAICYAQTGIGVAARKRRRGMMVCDPHAEALDNGRPVVGVPGTPDAEAA
jgi:hypothetical protein